MSPTVAATVTALACILNLTGCGQTAARSDAATPTSTTDATASARDFHERQRAFTETVLPLLRSAKHLTLYSLDPDAPESDGPARDEPDFHGYRVLGKTPVDDPTLKAKLIDALRKDVDESDGTVAFCFEPRHGIRVVDGARTVDLAICFTCLQVEAYVTTTYPATLVGNARDAFDGVLTAEGIEKAAPAK